VRVGILAARANLGAVGNRGGVSLLKAIGGSVCAFGSGFADRSAPSGCARAPCFASLTIHEHGWIVWAARGDGPPIGRVRCELAARQKEQGSQDRGSHGDESRRSLSACKPVDSNPANTLACRSCRRVSRSHRRNASGYGPARGYAVFDPAAAGPVHDAENVSGLVAVPAHPTAADDSVSLLVAGFSHLPALATRIFGDRGRVQLRSTRPQLARPA
jgi:hypothetical protein